MATVSASFGSKDFENRLKVVSDLLMAYKDDCDVTLTVQDTHDDNTMSIAEDTSGIEPLPDKDQEIMGCSSNHGLMPTIEDISENEPLPDLPVLSIPSRNDTDFIADSDTSGLDNAVSPARSKRKGRPCGAVKTAIGLPRFKQAASPTCTTSKRGW